MSDMFTVPVIRLEVERMRHTILAALSEHAASMDRDLRNAVNAYCAEGNIAEILRTEARKAIDDAVKEEVRRFFGYTGAGRQAIREAVLAHLDEIYPSV